MFFHLLYLKLTIKNLKIQKWGSLQTPFVETLIISLKIVELIVGVIISIVVNPTFWHNVYLVSMCSITKSIALLVGFESSFFFCLHP
jgi:hypothetical protein